MSARRLLSACLATVLVLAWVAGSPEAASAARPRLTISVSDSSVALGQTVTVTVRATKAAARQKVHVQRKSASGWRTLATKRLPRSTPRKVRFAVPITRSGPNRLRAVLVAGHGRRGATSSTVTVRGVARPDGLVEPVVDGNRLVDSRTGDTWVPRGVNWPDLEYSCAQGWKPVHKAAENDAMASWGIDLVRIPLNEDCWLGTDGAPDSTDGEWVDAADYRAVVQQRVDRAHAAGLAVILDLHLTGPAGVMAGDDQRAMADAQSVEFWGEVAAAYQDDPSVMFELFNEPYDRPELGSGDLDWDCWRDGGCEVDVADQHDADVHGPSGTTYEVAGMADMLAAVRDAGATQPVLLGGLNYANDLTGWLAHRPDDDQLVAAWHNYHGQGCGKSCWDSTITSVAAQVPVLMTEFGWSSDKASWMSDVMDWGDAHGVGYLPWAWWQLTDEEIADDPALAQWALLEPDSYAARAPAGTTYKKHLQSLPG